MLFNSYIFIFLFLPMVLCGYFLLNHFGRYRTAMVYICFMSLWFYGYFNPMYLLLILGSICVNYLGYRMLLDVKNAHARRAVVIAIIIFNIGLLFYYKYFDFFIENINIIFQTKYEIRNVLLPMRISFFTFQQLSFIVDSYKKKVPVYGMLDYAEYVLYFPQLVAGPIVRYDEMLPQFADIQKKKLNWANFSEGIVTFTLGLAKNSGEE